MNAKIFRLLLLILMTVQVAAIQPTSSVAAPAQDTSNPCAPGASPYPENTSDSGEPGAEDDRIVAAESARATRWLPLIPVPAANLVFSDDFDTFGDTRLWRGTDALTPEEEDIWSGPVSIRATGESDGPGAFARKVLGSGYNDISMKVRFKVLSLGPNPVEVIAFRGGTDQVLASLEVTAEGTLSIVNAVTDRTIHSSVVVSQGEWHSAQLRLWFDVDNGIYRTQVWFNGVYAPELFAIGAVERNLVDDFAADTELSGGVTSTVQFGNSTEGRIYQLLFDDVIVADSYIEPWQQPVPEIGNEVDQDITGDSEYPFTLTVQSSPVMEGVPFVLDGESFITDAEGRAQVGIRRWSADLRQRITSPETRLESGIYTKFGRWYEWGGVEDTEVVAALNLFYEITWSFHDLEGDPVANDMVDSVTFKNSLGVYFTFERGQHGVPHLLQGDRIIPSFNGRELKPLYFTLESVCIRGTNVVHRAKQRWFPNEVQSWEIKLLFFSAHVSSHDAFFGYSSGSTLNIMYPDGKIEEVPLDENGEAYLPKLPRGNYELSVTGPGYSPPRPVAITRDQIVELEIVSYVDMAFAATLLAIAGFGLLFVGRPQLYRVPIRVGRRILVPTRSRRKSRGPEI